MRRAIQICVLVAAAGPVAFAQAQVPAFPRPAWFRQHFTPPPTRVELQAPLRFSDYIVGGSLELSLRAYLELAMQNNSDIALARLVVETPKNAMTRALAGFDPMLSASFSSTRATQTSYNSLEGVPTVKTLQQPFTGTYSQTLQSGAQVVAQFSSQRTSTNYAYATYNPAFYSSLYFGFDQPLLRNRGAALTKLSLLVARSGLHIGELQLRSQVLALVANAEMAYWNVVGARENLAMANRFLELRSAALDRAKKQVDAKAILPMQVYQPESEYASAQLAVIQAKSSLAKAENALRRQIGADLDPTVRTMPVVLTEPLTTAMATPPQGESAVAAALKLRPDYLAAAASLDSDDLGIRAATEALRPSVSLTGAYQSQGVGGNYLPGNAPGGFGDALSQLFRFNTPVYSFGLKLSLPVRDHNASANLADAQAQKKRDLLTARKLEQTLRLQVINAIEDLASARASLEQAQLARDFADKRFAAEKQKNELGIQDLFFVLTAQTDLNAKESMVLQQSLNYRANLINLYEVTGELLDQRGIIVR